MLRIEVGSRVGEAIIQNHHDVRAKRDLNINRELGAQEMRAAVEMRLEPDAVFTDIAQRTQAEDLKSAAVGEDRPVPSHEPVEPAQTRHRLLSGPQEEVV